MTLKKNDVLNITIDDIGTNGEGIGHVDGYALFVRDALPGEVVEVKVMKANKNFGFARLMKIMEPSPARREPVCENAGPCGGCTLLHCDYSEQAKFKQKRVYDCVTRIGGVDFSSDEAQFLPIIGAEDGDEYFYRNKAQFPVREGEDGKLKVGFFAGRSHRLIPVKKCMIQNETINNILEKTLAVMNENLDVISGYNEEKHKGLLRHIFVRIGVNTGQAMLCLVINGNKLPRQEEIVGELSKIESVTSIVLNVNKEKTNVILGKKMITVYGTDYIEDMIGDIRYEISPHSFFQVNPKQTRKLYEKALEFAALTGSETVWDLYCGIGTISLFLARKAKHVIGVEIVPSAIENAKKNAKKNEIENAEFYCGAAEDVVEKIYSEDKSKSGDVVVVDPPRKGCDKKLLSTIVDMNPKRIVYVSCDPATLARDIKVLGESGYAVKKVQPVDMFAQSGHVETIVALQRKNTL